MISAIRVGLRLRLGVLLAGIAFALLMSPAAQAGGLPDLGVRFLPAPEVVSPGSQVSYSIVVTNSGPVAATLVDLHVASRNQTTFPFGSTVTQDLSLAGPPGWSCIFLALPPSSYSCSIASMPAGTANFVFTLRTNSGASGTFQVGASVNSTPADPNVANNEATINGTIVSSVPALSPARLALLAGVLMLLGLFALERGGRMSAQ